MTKTQTPLTFQGRLYLSANADRRIHLSSLTSKPGNYGISFSLCGYAPTQVRPATTREAHDWTFCETCLSRAQA